MSVGRVTVNDYIFICSEHRQRLAVCCLKYHYDNVNLSTRIFLPQFRVIRDHLNSNCFTSIIVFDIQYNKKRQFRIRSTPIVT